MAKKHEAKVNKAAQALFEKQKSSILGKLQSAKQAPDPFDLDEWIDEFKKVIPPLLRSAITEAGKKAFTDFLVESKNVEKFIRAREQKFAIKLNKDTFDELKGAFEQAIKEGKGLQGMMDEVERIMGNKIVSSPETIARTEIIGSLNQGTMEGWRQSGVVSGKVWIATLDDRTREAHADAHGQTVGIDEPFIVDGEELDHPGDSSGGAGNVINCRCTMKAVVS